MCSTVRWLMNSEFQSQLDQLEQDISSIDGGRFDKMADEIKKTMDSSIARQMYDVHRRLAVLNGKGQIRKKDFEEKMGQLNMISMEINGETVGQWMQQEVKFGDTIPYFIEKEKYSQKTTKWLSKGTLGARVSLDEKTIENSTTRGVDLYLNNGGWSWKRESIMDLPDIHENGFLADRREGWGVGRLGVRYSQHINGKWNVEDYINLDSKSQLFLPHFISDDKLVFSEQLVLDYLLNYCVLDPILIKERKKPEIRTLFRGGKISGVSVVPEGLAISHTKRESEDILTFIDLEGNIIDEAHIAETFDRRPNVKVMSSKCFFCVYRTPDGSIIYQMDKSNNGLWQRNEIWMSPHEIDDYQILPNQKIALTKITSINFVSSREFGILDLTKLNTSSEYNLIDTIESGKMRLQCLPNGVIYVINADKNQLIKYDGKVADE